MDSFELCENIIFRAIICSHSVRFVCYYCGGLWCGVLCILYEATCVRALEAKSKEHIQLTWCLVCFCFILMGKCNGNAGLIQHTSRPVI